MFQWKKGLAWDLMAGAGEYKVVEFVHYAEGFRMIRQLPAYLAYVRKGQG